MKILVALYDRVTEAFAPVMTCHTRGEAIRSFRSECQNKESPISRNPTDYELYVVGTYDETSGKIDPTIERIARAEDHTS